MNSGFGDSSSSFGHGSNSDVEKGGYGGDVISKMEAIGGVRGDGPGYGAATGSGPQRGHTQRSMTSLNSYSQQPYAPPVQETYAQRGYGQAQPMAQVYNQPVQNAAYQQAIVSAPGQPYPQIMTYAGPYAQTQPVMQTRLSPTATSPSRIRESYQSAHLPNPFENAGSDAMLAASYDLARGAPIATQQFMIPRSAQMQRKPPPPFLTVNTNLSDGSQPGSAGSLSASPLRTTGGTVESPQEARQRRRSSLLNTPRTPTSALGHGRTASDGRAQSSRSMTSVSAAMVDYGRPPVAHPLPYEFGASNGPLPDSPKVLKVVNL